MRSDKVFFAGRCPALFFFMLTETFACLHSKCLSRRFGLCRGAFRSWDNATPSRINLLLRDSSARKPNTTDLTDKIYLPLLVLCLCVSPRISKFARRHRNRNPVFSFRGVDAVPLSSNFLNKLKHTFRIISAPTSNENLCVDCLPSDILTPIQAVLVLCFLRRFFSLIMLLTLALKLSCSTVKSSVQVYPSRRTRLKFFHEN